ncbi:MAG: saccharopine dehydrogenase NADP-binding domain-containing protein [Actinomycetes bacterium]
MAGRVILFGATGYTGELTARELVSQGAEPVLVARSHDRVGALAEELGGLETAVADVTDPTSVAAVLSEGDALVTTVGPFVRLGEPALRAAMSAGAHYVDSTGEPVWIRRVFEDDSNIKAAGIAALTAFGYDYVPGNLAAGLALDRAEGEPVRVDVGYFTTGGFGASGGTQASLVGALLSPGFEWRDGSISVTYGAGSERNFRTTSGQRTGLSIGASEHFAIPRLDPGIKDVGAYLGWFGSKTAPARYGSIAVGQIARLPGVRKGLTAAASKLVPGSTGGPTESERARTGSLAVAEAIGADGKVLSHVELRGPNAYELTASFLAWAGLKLSGESPKELGAIGPVEAYGLQALADGCAAAGLVEA